MLQAVKPVWAMHNIPFHHHSLAAENTARRAILNSEWLAPLAAACALVSLGMLIPAQTRLLLVSLGLIGFGGGGLAWHHRTSFLCVARTARRVAANMARVFTPSRGGSPSYME